eukprot:scaffold1009_cov375-Prasinococcus_capsulatus_cf.AAC.2
MHRKKAMWRYWSVSGPSARYESGAAGGELVIIRLDMLSGDLDAALAWTSFGLATEVEQRSLLNCGHRLGANH